MKERWRPAVILAGLLFAVYVVARFVAWKAASASAQDRVALIATAGVALLSGVTAFWWARRYPMPRVIGDLAVATGVAALLGVLVGAFFGSKPFAGGAWLLIGRFGLFVGLSALGALLGILLVMALGLDWKSQAWKRHADNIRRKPPRMIRR